MGAVSKPRGATLWRGTASSRKPQQERQIPLAPPLYPDIGESCISQPLKPSVQPEAGGLRTSGHQVERGQSWP